MHERAAVHTGHDVISHDADAARQPLEPIRGPGLDDVEQTEDEKPGEDADTAMNHLWHGLEMRHLRKGIFHEYRSRGLNPSEPEVGNGLWVTSVVDPDGFKLFFESPTDVAEDTKLSEIAST